MTKTQAKAFAATANFAVCLLNIGIVWAFHDSGSDWYIMNVMAAIFSGVLTIVNFVGFLNSSFDDSVRENVRYFNS